MSTPTARDDHLIIELVKSLGQPSADARTAAGDEIALPESFMTWARSVERG
jgi:hypothetical protein